MFISMHSILDWVSFCMNYCINAAWHGGNKPVALLGCNEAQVALIAAFRSSALLGLVSLIFLLTIPHRFSMAIKHSNTMVIEPAFGTFGSVGIYIYIVLLALSLVNVYHLSRLPHLAVIMISILLHFLPLMLFYSITIKKTKIKLLPCVLGNTDL